MSELISLSLSCIDVFSVTMICILLRRRQSDERIEHRYRHVLSTRTR